MFANMRKASMSRTINFTLGNSKKDTEWDLYLRSKITDDNQNFDSWYAEKAGNKVDEIFEEAGFIKSEN